MYANGKTAVRLFGWLMVAAVGCSPGLRELPPPSVPVPLVIAQGTMSWEVVDPFLLVSLNDGSPDGLTTVSYADGTAELLRRVRDYVQMGNRQDNVAGLMPTRWSPGWRDYRTGYLQPRGVPVRVHPPGGFHGRCAWQVDHGAEQVQSCSDPYRTDSLSFGISHVVTVRPVDAPATAPGSIDIKLRNVIVATVGDSYASGEGVPDIRSGSIRHVVTFADARWTDQRCHRSLFSGHAIAALLYTQLNPHVAVTYVSYACSGALLTKGLLEPYAGADPKDPDDPLDPQLNRLLAILGDQRADFVTVSFGGNDIGFADIVTNALLQNDGQFGNAVGPGVQAALVPLRIAARIAGATQAHLAFAKHVILVGYLNPTLLITDKDIGEKKMPEVKEILNKCSGGFAGTVRFAPRPISNVLELFGGDFDNLKLSDLETYVVKPLRDFTLQFGRDLGIEGPDVVTGALDDDFREHGFCGPGLNTAQDTHWINTVHDSWRTQGDLNQSGAMHPNIRGQAAIAKEILEKLVSHECTDGQVGTDVAGICRWGTQDGRWWSVVGLPEPERGSH